MKAFTDEKGLISFEIRCIGIRNNCNGLNRTHSHVMMIDIEVAVCHGGLEGVTECLFRFESNRNDVLFLRYC